MIRSGVVVAVHTLTSVDRPSQNGSPAKLLTVRLDTLVGCGSCSAAGGCGVQLLPSANKAVQIECPLPPNSRVSVGQTVQVSIPEPTQGWLILVLSAYGWPTIGMLGGAMAGFWAATLLDVAQHQELFSVLGFAVGLGGGLLAWNRMNKSGDPAWSQAVTDEMSGELTGELVSPLNGYGQLIRQEAGQAGGTSAVNCSHILKQENKT